MSYRLENDEDPAAGFKRIADEQAEKALRHLHERPEGDHALANLLGDSHDLAVLQQRLHKEPSLEEMRQKEAFAQEMELLQTLAEQRRRNLHQVASPMGRRNYAEKPKVLLKRMGAYWKIWTEQ